MLKKLLLCSVLLGAVPAFATAGVSDEAVKIFGTDEAKERIAKGALFIDGLFIRGPYSVTREGNVILVNGRIANRFKVKASAGEPEPEEEEPVADADASEAEIPEIEEAPEEASDEVPTLDDVAPARSTAKQPSAIEKRLATRGGGIDDRLAARKKQQDLKKASAAGSFNTGKGTGYDPEALFEEADYTYTPPSKPEPKAVPYIRPEAQLSAKERAAKAKAKDAEIMARASAKDEADTGADVAEADTADADDVPAVAAADESFDGLSDKEIAAYTKRFAARRAAIESALKVNGLVLLSSASDGVKAEKQPIMWRFMQDLPALCEASSSEKLLSKWGKLLPRAYLQLIYDNREKNATNMKTILLRIKRESKAAKERSRNRI